MELFVILSTILVVLVQSLSCQKLVAVEVNAKFPVPTYYHASLYDGNDTIFMLGGLPNSTVYSYSVSANTDLVEITSFQNASYDGFAMFNDQGDILYIGGLNYGFPDGNIYKLELNTLSLKVVDTNRKFGFGRGVKATDGSNTLFIPTKNGDMHCLNLSIFESCGTTSLLSRYHSVRPFVHDCYAYLTGTDPIGLIEKVNLETLESELIDAKLPYLRSHELVFDGRFAYIIGSSFASNNGITRLNPQTMEHQFFTVDNFPVNYANPSSYWNAGSAVYVKKLNRIYFSGGITGPNDGSRDEIWYIDLTPISEPIPSTTTEDSTSYATTEVQTTATSTGIPISTTLNPDIFTCVDKPQGFYPHPYDCAKFIGCHNGTEEFYECPSPLLFSPILLRCTFPEDVDCEISCTGKPDGMYEHPHDCSLFIACHNTMLEIYKCPTPLLFDPETKQCNFPEEVDCKTESK